MKNTIIILILLIYSFSLNGQIRDFHGAIIDKSNNPIPFVKVILLYENRIVGGASTDFDGKYSILKIPYSIDSLEIEIKPTECYIGKKLNFILENDTIIKTVVLDSYDCDSITEDQCKFHSDSCNIYDVKYLWDSPRGKRKYRKVEKENEKVIYMQTEYYYKECCEKKYYCKTHKYRY